MIHVGMPRDTGVLKQVSPEEITAAYIMAIANDAERQEGEDTTKVWVSYVRSAVCAFIVLDSDMDKYWYAA